TLTRRHYRLSEFTNVLVRQIHPGEQIPETPGAPLARLATDSEAELYAGTVIRGFFGRDEVSTEELNLGRTLFAVPGNQCYFAILDGVAAACGQVGFHTGVATCFGDSTLVSYRR